MITQSLPAAVDTATHGSELHTQCGTDLLVGQSFDVTQHDRGAELRGQRIERCLQIGVQAGVVSVGNYSEGDLSSPFGGWNQSGFGGAEKSLRAFEQWTREKAIWIELQ